MNDRHKQVDANSKRYMEIVDTAKEIVFAHEKLASPVWESNVDSEGSFAVMEYVGVKIA